MLRPSMNSTYIDVDFMVFTPEVAAHEVSMSQGSTHKVPFDLEIQAIKKNALIKR